MSEASELSKTITDIIKAAGGPRAIAEASEATDSRVSVDAVYKWPQIGIPDRHWPLIMPLAGATADEMLAANVAARSPEQAIAS